MHSMSRPPLGGVEGTGLEEALGLCWNWPGVGKGWFLSTCQTHVNARGSLRLLFSHGTVHEHLRLSQEVTHLAGRAGGWKERGSALWKAHILAAVPHSRRHVAWSQMDSGRECDLSQAQCLRLGEWESRQSLGLTAATAHPSPCRGPGTQLGQEKEAESPSFDAAGDHSLSRALCPGLPLPAPPPPGCSLPSHSHGCSPALGEPLPLAPRTPGTQHK